MIFWDTQGEYPGAPISWPTIRAALTEPAFTAAYRPADPNPAREFHALARYLLRLGQSPATRDRVAGLALCVDEVNTVAPDYKENGMGELLRYSRRAGLNLFWASQRPTHLPTTLFSEVNRLYVFHLHHPVDLRALSPFLSPSDLQAVAGLPAHQYLTVSL